MSSKPPAPAVTQQTQQVKLPAWVEEAGKENYEFAKNLADRPFVPYTGERVAGQTALEQSAAGFMQGGAGTANQGFQTALGAAEGAAGFQGGRIDAPTGYDGVTAGSWLNQNIQRYMDPNIENVINPTLDNMRRSAVLNEQRASDAARAAGVRPGNASRYAVGEAVRGAETARNMAATEAGLRSQAFESAAGRAGQDIQTALQAALANQQAGITTTGQRIQAQSADAASRAQAAGINIQGGQLAQGTGAAAGALGNQTAMTAAGLGAAERELGQRQLDVNYQTFMDQQNEGQKDLEMRLQALGMTPYGKTTSGTTTQTTPTSSNPWMTGIGAAATFLPMFFSDRRTKKGIKKIGVDAGGLNLYEFKYKKDFGNDNAKQVGFMADDVEKKIPKAKQKGIVQTVKTPQGKVKMVDYGKAMRDSRDDRGKPRRKYKPRVRGFMAA